MKTTSSRILHTASKRLSSIEEAFIQPQNALSFLLIRFVLMSGMILGFAWAFHKISP